MQSGFDRKFLLVLAIAFVSGFASWNFGGGSNSILADTLEAYSEANVNEGGEIAVVTDVVVEQMPEVTAEPAPVLESPPEVLPEVYDPTTIQDPLLQDALQPTAADLAIIAPVETILPTDLPPESTIEDSGVITDAGVVSEVGVIEDVNVVPDPVAISDLSVLYPPYTPPVYIPEPETSYDPAMVMPPAPVYMPQVSLLNRQFNAADIGTEQEHKALKKARRESMSELIERYYFEQAGASENFVYLNDGVYYLKFNLDDIWSDPTADPVETFSVIDSDAHYLEDQGLYFVDLFFSQNVDYQALAKNKFFLQSNAGEEFAPNSIFAFGKEVVLVYQNQEKPEMTMIKFDNFGGLNGFYPLTKNTDTYKTLASAVSTEYQAIVGEDITFDTTKLSFGEFNAHINPSSTIAIKIPETPTLTDQCSILIFGEEMSNEAGDAKIPLSRLSLVTGSVDGVPIDEATIASFVTKNAKPFLGFAYVRDLELVQGYYALYLNLNVPQDVAKGRYSTDISFEVFCP